MPESMDTEHFAGPRPTCRELVAQLVGRRASGPPAGRRRGTVTFRGIHWWPAPGAVNLDESIPEAVAECFSEGVRCLGAHAPRAAAVMSRRTLEAVVRTSGSTAAVEAVYDSSSPGLAA